ncbi:MAG: SPFH domain-containing protein [Thermodesulfobacteriota bacterium]|nr:SPFH domain-containing protein [Thermodesulfobacteriota bacterium]
MEGEKRRAAAFSDMLARSLKFRMPAFGRTRGVKIALAVIVAVALAYNMFFVYVEPNEFGIKVVRVGIDRGVHEEVYDAGLHTILPFGLQQMHRLPRDIQVLELTNYPDTAARTARRENAAHIQTSDGFFVDVDVSILFRIVDPYLVFTIIGPGTLYQDNGIIPKAEPILKATLGELTTEEFYNSPLRVQKAEAAKVMLNQELKAKGLSVEQVLVRYFKYSDEIQKNIEEKKLKDQLVFKNQAEARAAIEEAKLKKIVQEGKVSVEVKFEEGKAYVTRKRAEKDMYVRKKKAEADLLVKLAEAEKVRLKNEALEGRGAERMVGLKMADVYKGLNMVILPSDGTAGVNPLDLGNTLELFDVRKGGAQ